MRSLQRSVPSSQLSWEMMRISPLRSCSQLVEVQRAWLFQVVPQALSGQENKLLQLLAGDLFIFAQTRSCVVQRRKRYLIILLDVALQTKYVHKPHILICFGGFTKHKHISHNLVILTTATNFCKICSVERSCESGRL